MGDDTKILDQNPVSASVSNNVVQPQVGSLNKEVPLTTGLPELKPSGPEVRHEIGSELQELGVEERKDNPDLTFEHKQLGVDHAGPHVPVPSGPTGKITLPMSEEEIENQLKTGQDDDSRKWLAWLFKKIIKWGFKNQ